MLLCKAIGRPIGTRKASMNEQDKKLAAVLGLTIVPNRTSKIATVKTESRVLHEEIEIKCFFEGSSTLLIGSETVSVKAGDVVIIAGTGHETTQEIAGVKHPFDDRAAVRRFRRTKSA